MKAIFSVVFIASLICTSLCAQEIPEGADYTALRSDILLLERTNELEGARAKVLDEVCRLWAKIKWSEPDTAEFLLKAEAAGEDIDAWSDRLEKWSLKYGAPEVMFVSYCEALLFGSFDLTQPREDGRDNYTEALVKLLDRFYDHPEYGTEFRVDLLKQLLSRHSLKGADLIVDMLMKQTDIPVIYGLLSNVDEATMAELVGIIADKARLETLPAWQEDYKTDNDKRALRRKLGLITRLLERSLEEKNVTLARGLIQAVDERITNYKDFEYVLQEEFSERLMTELALLPKSPLADDVTGAGEQIIEKKKAHIPVVANTYESKPDPLADEKKAEEETVTEE